MKKPHESEIRTRGPLHLGRLIRPLAVLVVFGLLIWAIASCVSRVFSPATPTTEAEEYPGPWTPPSGAVYRAMNIKGYRCSEGYARASAKNPGEHLIYCHEPNGTWVAYLVWFPSNRILGPDRTYAYLHTSSIALPERDPDAVALDTMP